MNELVSVIVPIYQSEKYLERCICSIISQTYLNLEILLIDDGSTDQSLMICKEYEQQDNRIRVFHQENQGVSSARNVGLEKMTGAYVMFFDADDYIDVEMIEDLMSSALAASADLVICGFRMVYEDGRPNLDYHVLQSFSGNLNEYVEHHMLESYDRFLLNTQCNKLCSTELIRKQRIRYIPGMSINEDIYISMKMLQNSKQIVSLNRSYLNYWQYQQPQSLVTRFNQNGVETCLILLAEVCACLDQGQASKDIRNRMNNRMLAHICGFAGLPYYRSDYTNRQCYQGIKMLTTNRQFRKLLWDTKARGAKNKVAANLLRLRMSFLYHLLCLVVYKKKRQCYRQKRKSYV